MKAEVVESETGFSVSGKIHFDNILALRRQGDRMINSIVQKDLVVDLSGIESSDSSGLSLLLRWLRYAGQQGKTLRIINMPESLYKVAEVCGIATLLGVAPQ